MRPANLLPTDFQTTRRKLPGAAFAAVGAGAAIGALVTAGFFIEHGKVEERQAQLETLKVQLAAIPKPVQPKIQVSPQLTAEKDTRFVALNEALAGRIAWDRVLRELSLVLPEDVWLNNLSATSPTGATATPGTPAATSTGITFKGYTYSQEGVARLLTRLALVPNLQNVKLQSSTTSEVAEREIVGFTIGAEVRPPGGPTS